MAFYADVVLGLHDLRLPLIAIWFLAGTPTRIRRGVPLFEPLEKVEQG
jgi:hypothetical protein